MRIEAEEAFPEVRVTEKVKVTALPGGRALATMTCDIALEEDISTVTGNAVMFDMDKELSSSDHSVRPAAPRGICTDAVRGREVDGLNSSERGLAEMRVT
jgi:hypothetical protein